MSESSRPSTTHRRRTILAIAAAVTALGVAGTGAAVAASSDGSTKPSKIVAPNAVRPQMVVSGSPVNVGPGGYASSTITCPAGTLLWSAGESNTAPGTLVLTDSWPVTDAEWLVFVKSNDPTNTYSFTMHAICR